jgi:predicted negative regulator of RcsB-dependent stress response
LIRRYLFLPAILLAASGYVAKAGQPPAPPGENQFSASISLFSTMAAINAAGYDADLNSEANFPIRNQVRAEIAKRSVPSLRELKEFYHDHRKGTDASTLSQYISFALLTAGPPDFKLDIADLPPDVEPLVGLPEILSRFYKEANIAELWGRSQPAFQAALQRYQESVINGLLEANAYLRNPTSGEHGRHFQIYMSLLASPNVVQVRNYRADYFVVITPSREPMTDEIRAAYLSYLLDPLSLRYSKALDSKKELLAYAENAPALEDAYKNEFSLLVTKSLIKAVESRLMRGEEKRQAYVDQAMREGFILTASFAELLPYYEKQPQAMRLYYPTLMNQIDVGRERKRLKTIQFARAVNHPVVAPAHTIEQANPAFQTLQQAQSLLEQHDITNANKLFKKSLQESDDKQMHAEAFFGMGQIAIQERQADQAVNMFRKVVELNSNPGLTAWSYVYLGRLAMLRDDSKEAGDQFRKALAIDGAPDKAKEAAQNDLQKISGENQ